MSMAPYFAHKRTCSVCSAFPHMLCPDGKALLKEGAVRLTKQLIKNPRRARA